MSSRDRIAFIHWGSWGDLYVSTAALSEALRAYPDRKAIVIGPDKWLQIINPETWPQITTIIVSKNGWSGKSYSFDSNSSKWVLNADVSLLKIFSQAEAVFNVRTESLRYAWAPFFARVPMRKGSARAPWSKILYTEASPWLGKDPIIHERDRMLQVIEGPGRIGELAKKWRASGGLPKLKTPNRSVAESLAHADFGKYWLINPTSSRREKAWPAEKFRELFTRLAPKLSSRGLSLKILGAPSETEWLKDVLPEGVSASETLVQPPTIQELLDVLGGAQVLITNTSSIQFLSPGQGVRTITLVGRANPEIWGPLGPRDTVIQGRRDPALDHDIFAQEREAYRSIEIETVEAKCRQFLEENLV